MHHPDPTHYQKFATTLALVNSRGGIRRSTNEMKRNHESRNNNNSKGYNINSMNSNNNNSFMHHCSRSNDRIDSFHLDSLDEGKEDFWDSNSEMFVPTLVLSREEMRHQNLHRHYHQNEEENQYYSDYEIVEYEESEEEWTDDFPANPDDELEFGDIGPPKNRIPQVVIAEYPTSFDVDSPSFRDFLEEEKHYNDSHDNSDHHGDCLSDGSEDDSSLHHHQHECCDDKENKCFESRSQNGHLSHHHQHQHNEERERSIYGDHDDDQKSDCYKIDCHRRHYEETHHACELCNHLCVHDRQSYLDRLSPTSSLDCVGSTISSAPSTLCEDDKCEHFRATSLQLSLKYSKIDWVLTGEVMQAMCPINHRKKNRPVYWRVHIALLPFKRQRVKTRYKSTSTPIFNETFQLVDIAKKALCQLSVRFRVYGRYSRYRRKYLAGECEVHLGILEKKQGFELHEWVTLTKDGICKDDQSIKSNRSRQSIMSGQTINSKESINSERTDSNSSDCSSCSSKSSDIEGEKKVCDACDEVLM